MKDAEPNIAPMEVAGNRLTLLADGPERLEALIALIDEARESLRILYYIWENDEAGRRVRDALLAAAERGVQVVAAGRRLRRVGRAEGLLRAADRGAGAASAASCRAGAGAICCATTRSWRSPTAAGRSSAGSTFPTIISARSRTAPGATSASRSRAPSVECLVRYFEALFAWAETPDASIRRLQADAQPVQRPRRPAALAVRRADAAAEPVGAVGQARPDAGAAGRHHLRLFRARACR